MEWGSFFVVVDEDNTILVGVLHKNKLFIFFLNSSLAETPPAKTMDLVSGYCLRARVSFSRRMSMAVCWNEAEKSAICWELRCFLKS